MRRLWGVNSTEMQGAFGSGRLLRIARRSDFSLYLFVPRNRRPELFVGLGYSVLTEDDPVRRRESVAVLDMIAQEMTPAERKRTGGLLRSSGWGSDLLREGYAALMNDENRSMAEVRGARFHEYQKTADFWLRAGNMYELLGLNREMKDAWLQAQALSGNKDMLSRMLALRKKASSASK